MIWIGHRVSQPRTAVNAPIRQTNPAKDDNATATKTRRPSALLTTTTQQRRNDRCMCVRFYVCMRVLMYSWGNRRDRGNIWFRWFRELCRPRTRSRTKTIHNAVSSEISFAIILRFHVSTFLFNSQSPCASFYLCHAHFFILEEEKNA